MPKLSIDTGLWIFKEDQSLDLKQPLQKRPVILTSKKVPLRQNHSRTKRRSCFTTALPYPPNAPPSVLPSCDCSNQRVISGHVYLPNRYAILPAGLVEAFLLDMKTLSLGASCAFPLGVFLPSQTETKQLQADLQKLQAPSSFVALIVSLGRARIDKSACQNLTLWRLPVFWLETWFYRTKLEMFWCPWPKKALGCTKPSIHGNEKIHRYWASGRRRCIHQSGFCHSPKT